MKKTRYSMQLDCAEGFSQQSLRDASVAIIGMGGLGCTASMLLAAAGVGTLYLYDFDCVAPSNLNRQLLYSEADIGTLKVHVAAQKLQKLNPDCSIIAMPYKISAQSNRIVEKSTVILDCLDSLLSRIELIQYATATNTPVIHAAIHGFYGQLSVFIPPTTSCPLCFTSHKTIDEEKSPPSIGCCVSTIASLQATEAIKFMSGIGSLCTNKIMTYDMLMNASESIETKKSTHCVACSSQ